MMIQRNTEARDDDDDGLIKEADEKSKQTAVSILSESTGWGCEQIGKSIANVCNVKLPFKYIMDKERPAVEKMEIVPAGSTYDKCALQCGISDINCTSEGEPATALSLSARMPSDWKFSEDEACIIVSKRKVCESVQVARLSGEYKDYMGMMVEKHKLYGRDIKDGDGIIVIDSFDGAEHLKTKKKVTSVISFCHVCIHLT
jgi:hypothetical protein